MKTGVLLKFPEPETVLEPMDAAVAAERLVDLSILLQRGEVTLKDVQEEVLTWQAK